MYSIPKPAGSKKPVPPTGKTPRPVTGGPMPKPDAKVQAMKQMLDMKKASKR